MSEQQTADEIVEVVARALAKADGIEICDGASYRHSTYGPKARAAIASARPMIEAEEREKCAKVAEQCAAELFDYSDDIATARGIAAAIRAMGGDR